MGEQDMDSTDRDDIIWAAGFFDGEGTFGVQVRKDGNRVFPWYIYAATAQVKPGALETFERLFGGKVRMQRSVRSPTLTSSLQYYGMHFMWQVYGARAYEVAKTLLPYLKLKKRHAEILCEIYPLAKKRGRRFINAQTDADVEYLNALAAECRALNKRRVPLPDVERLSGEAPEAVPGDATVRPLTSN